LLGRDVGIGDTECCVREKGGGGESQFERGGRHETRTVEKGSHVDALDSSLLVVDNDSVDVPSEDDRDGGLILGLSRLAEIDDSSVNTCFLFVCEEETRRVSEVAGEGSQGRERKGKGGSDSPGKIVFNVAKVSLNFVSFSVCFLSAPAWTILV